MPGFGLVEFERPRNGQENFSSGYGVKRRTP